MILKKRLFIAMLIVINTGIFYAQKPSELIANAKQQNESFQQVSLLSITQDKSAASTIDQAFKNYSLLDFDQTAARSIKENASKTLTISIPGEGTRNAMVLELVKVDILEEGFQLTVMPENRVIETKNTIVHYQGIVQGNANSVVAISVTGKEVYGLISSHNQQSNIVIGKLDNSDQHIIYYDSDIRHLNAFDCHTEPDETPYSDKDIFTTPYTTPQRAQGVGIFFDIAKDIVDNKGGAAQAGTYIQALFNQVSVLYTSEMLNIGISGMKAWTTNESWDNNLGAYRTFRNSKAFAGQLAHLVTYDYSGGIAYVGVLCNRNVAYGLSGIESSFSNVPTYSWSVYVLAHELGHNFGSNHTQKCVWNGNNTAIDGCAAPEGSCPRPAIPTNGGTVMSYCHLASTGINFSKGFGTQPGNLMRNRYSNANCLGDVDQKPYGGNVTLIPGTIQAENYDLGGQGIAYNDVNTQNSGGAYRTDGVDIAVASDPGGGFTVGWTANGEWLEYTTQVTAGTYKIEARLASGIANPGGLKVELDGANLGTINVTSTGGWQDYQTFTLDGVALTAGPNKVLKLTVVNGGLFNINWIKFTNENGGGSGSDIPDCGFTQLQSFGIDVGSANGKTYMVSNSNQVFERVNNAWTSLNFSNAIRIDGLGNGTPWVVRNDNTIHVRSNGSWQQKAGQAKDIGASGINVFLIGMDDRIYQHVNNVLQPLPTGAAKRVDVDSNGRPWVIGMADDVFEYLGNGNWSKKGTIKASDISVRENGNKVWVLEKGTGNVHYWENDTWNVFSGQLASISVGRDGTIWGTNGQNKIYKTSCSVSNVEVSGVVSSDDTIKIYPVPVNSELTIEFGGNSYKELSIIDVNGRVINTQKLENTKTQDIDVSQLDSGIYFLNFINDNKTVIKRLIKK